ncbi:MBL fold metallo-hydrolase [Williamsia herbipolensis]|uniref:MBL fold metallo-hydrolase n=1 Tax=Williamsia herbipolensis TaxID=1603258 RepID=UPI0005F7A778|nr:MBL fold metallo-hydrolase [Williamsia herbipolensis]
MSHFTITTVENESGGSAHLIHTEHVNWVLLRDDSGVTLIDGGYPKQVDDVIASVREIGAQPGDIRAALVTHAHVDHIGGLSRLANRYAFPVHLDPVEVSHARREHLQQATPKSLAKLAYKPRVLRWMAEIVALGGLDTTGIPNAEPFATSADGSLDLPGRPVPWSAHGHTDGHSAYLVAGGRVLVSGDALVTGHGITAHVGPQCIHPVFHHDEAANREALRALAERERLSGAAVEFLFPGHGEVHRGSVSDAVATALRG